MYVSLNLSNLLSIQVDWLKDISDRSIPLSLDVDPVEVLIDESTKVLLAEPKQCPLRVVFMCSYCLQAQWASEGLPIDSLSTQNGAIISSSSRVPLLVDPQLQVSACSCHCYSAVQPLKSAIFECIIIQRLKDV